MRSVLLVILSLFINGGCYHLLIVENLRKDFLILHSKIAKNVSNNETLRNDITLILKDYKPFVNDLTQLEKDILNHDFVENNTSLLNSIKIKSHFKSFINNIRKVSNPNMKFNKNAFINGFKWNNYTKDLEDFRTGSKNQTYFYDFLKEIQENVLERYSEHELCFLLYQYLTITDTKGLILTSFYKFITNNFSEALMIPPIANYDDILLSLNNVTADIWRRDPPVHKKGETYIEIEKFLQGVVVNERHMPPYNCRSECVDYNNVTVARGECNENNVSAFNCKMILSTYTETDLYDCQEVSTVLTTCQDTYPRIYKYLKFGYQTYGDDNARCTKMEQTFTKKKECSFCFYCSYCVCTMYYKRYSDKYISLRAAYSTIQENRVIVGARFQKHNKMIHIQVKEAILGPYLTVNETRWVSIERFQLTDRMIFKNQDYVEISMDKRSIHLGDVKLSHADNKYIKIKNYVLTGVRFYVVDGYLLLQIRCTRFDLKTGTLNTRDGSSWHDVSSWPTQEIEIENSDLPRDGGTSKIVNKDNNQFIKFTHSSFETDFAQTTVPFFDTQEAVSTGPLHGLGIYYKREVKSDNRKSGGFLGIRLLTYDFTDYLREMTN